jgi:hypothetical protein
MPVRRVVLRNTDVTNSIPVRNAKVQNSFLSARCSPADHRNLSMQSKTQNAYTEEPRISRRGYAHLGIMAPFSYHIVRWLLMPLISVQLYSRVGKESSRIVSQDNVGIGRVSTKQSDKGSESSG